MGVGLWKDIRKEAIQLLQNCLLEVGDRRKVRFWEDVWCGEVSLCSSFSSLYEAVGSKGAKVAELWKAWGWEEGGTSDFKGTLMIGRWNLRYNVIVFCSCGDSNMISSLCPVQPLTT